MRSAKFVLVFFALCAVCFATTTNHQRNEIGSQHKAITESAKRAIDSSARALKSGIDKFAPLARNGLNLSGDLAQRLLSGSSKKGRAFDDKLTRRLADFGREAKSAISDAVRGIIDFNPFSDNVIEVPFLSGSSGNSEGDK